MSTPTLGESYGLAFKEIAMVLFALGVCYLTYQIDEQAGLIMLTAIIVSSVVLNWKKLAENFSLS